MSKEEFKILTARDHVRTRIGMYMGSASKEEVDRFVLGEWKKSVYVPALSKMIDEILAPISDLGADGNQRLRNPAEVSDGDIRQVLAAVRQIVDGTKIPPKKIEVDISDEFKKSVETVLGRKLR